MKLIYHPNKFLDTKVDLVDVDNPEFDPKELKEQMVELMLREKGVGLSANQIELNKQVFVMGGDASDSTLCINPVVLQHTEEKVKDLEGCLSFPNVYVQVERPKEILAEWFDENLEKKRSHITGYSVKVFLHEWDHLQGVTFKDRVSRLRWSMALKKAKKLEKKFA